MARTAWPAIQALHCIIRLPLQYSLPLGHSARTACKWVVTNAICRSNSRRARTGKRSLFRDRVCFVFIYSQFFSSYQGRSLEEGRTGWGSV